ncbi:MAG: metallophosphatase family protein [bacterium]|nr:metallophosphatase family protein [bacterium]
MIGIISDIHGNLEALKSVLASGKEHNITQWVCLGDIVGYGADPEACIHLVRETCHFVVLGNHDEAAIQNIGPDDFNPMAQQAILWTRLQLSSESRSWLQSLPLTIHDKIRLYVHASPRNPSDWNYVYTASEAQRQISDLDASIRSCYIGHTHEPFRYVGSNGVELINVGSVGQPRDGDQRASYALIDESKQESYIVRIPYDIERARHRIIEENLPLFLADRLLVGH